MRLLGLSEGPWFFFQERASQPTPARKLSIWTLENTAMETRDGIQQQQTSKEQINCYGTQLDGLFTHHVWMINMINQLKGPITLTSFYIILPSVGGSQNEPCHVLTSRFLVHPCIEAEDIYINIQPMNSHTQF